MDRSRYLALLGDLVGFNTVSSALREADQPNVELIEYARRELEACGFEVQVHELSPHKRNLYAVRGGGPGGLLLTGHSDTVPCRPRDWASDPFKLCVRDGQAYGLGACDMKGFLALMLYLARELRSRTLPRRLGLLITADEESSMDGARAFAAHCPDRYALIVVGEPTQLQPLVAHKGYLCREFIFSGTSCHSSDPSRGLNAIDIAYEAIGGLRQLQTQLQEHGDDRFAVPYPTLNLGAIHGGDCANRLCDEVRLLFDVRPLGDMTAERINALLAELTARLEHLYPGRIALREVYADIDCFSNDDAALVGRVEELLECPGICESYCTEAGFLQRLGGVVVYGPGSIRHAHMADERLDLQEAELAYGRLLRLVGAFA